MTQLPKGWAIGTAGELAEVVGGATPRTDTPRYWGGEIPWITPDDLAKNHAMRVSGGRRTLTDEGLDSCSASLVPPGTVLFTSRAPIGYVAIAERPMATNQGFKSLVPSPALTSEFLYWQLMHLAEEIKGMGSGTTFAEVSKKVMTTVPLVVAPLAEQERIVAAIEEAFSLLEAGETALHSTHTRLKRMRDSVLTAAVTGQLVPQDPTDTPATQYLHEQGVVSDGPTGGLPEGWTAAAVGDLATVGTGSTPSRSTRRYWEDGSIPWVTSGLLNDGHVIAATEFVSDVALAETSLRLWPPGTLLMAMYGEGKTRGKCAELRIKATCNQACAAISLHEQLESLREYLHLFLDANYLVTRRLAAGGVQPNLNLGLVRALRVSVPPPEEQVRIVVEVERQFSFIEAAERAVDAALARSAGLRRSVLKAAFEGRLVEQDPADEPASVLLERIAAERAVAAPRKRVPGRARGKVVAS